MVESTACDPGFTKPFRPKRIAMVVKVKPVMREAVLWEAFDALETLDTAFSA